MTVVIRRSIPLALLLAGSPAGAEHRALEGGGFAVEHEIVVPGAPGDVFDDMTGDVSDWWDHTFSEKPVKLVIEPEPGGGFYEIFNDRGDGALHATVLYAERGVRLRFDGPLGLSGNAVQMVHSFEFQAVGPDSTRVTLDLRASGAVEASWPQAVDDVWRHFLVERFKPHVEVKRGRR